MQDLLIFLEKINIFLTIFQKKKGKFYSFFMKEVKILNIEGKVIRNPDNSFEKINKVTRCRRKINFFRKFLVDVLDYKMTYCSGSYTRDLLFTLKK